MNGICDPAGITKADTRCSLLLQCPDGLGLHGKPLLLESCHYFQESFPVVKNLPATQETWLDL